MRGLKTDPVQELRRVLRDLYGFEAIVRELLQNADDAKAEQFHIAWSDDWEGAHPLLTGPAILVLNNGEFTQRDAEAIYRLDVGAKGADIGAIGKYGLGMKSVFHLCEGFFYFASENQPVTPSPFFELLTPWAQTDGYGDWENCERAKRALRDRLRAWPHKCSRWFCLAIPLRQPAHAVRGRLLKREFHEIKAFLDSISESQLAMLLPLLRNIEVVVVWNYCPRAGTFTPCVRVRLSSPQVRRLSFPEISRGERRPISGRLALERPDARDDAVEVLFAGHESLLADPCFAQLKQKEAWPRNVAFEAASGETRDEPEKAEPHCAAVILATQGGSGALHVRPAVFLPVTEELESDVPCPGETAFQLMLHGYFFLDAGRRRVVFDDEKTTGIHAEWNRQLYARGTLPLVLPAIDEFARTFSVADDLLTALTESLSKTKLFAEHKQELCVDRQWVYRLRWLPDRLGEWVLEPSSELLFELPSPSADTDNSVIGEALPALPVICQERVVTLATRPRLAAKEAAKWADHPDVVRRLLQSTRVESLDDVRVLQYLADFLKAVGALPSAALADLIRNCARALAVRSPGTRDAWTSAFCRLVQLLGNDSWVRLGGVERDAERLVYQLNALELRHLVLPPELAPSSGGARLALDKCRDIAQWLVGLSTRQRNVVSTRQRNVVSTRQRNVAAVAFRVIEATEADRAAMRAAIGELPLFLIRGAGETAAKSPASWNELEELHQARRLFAGRSSWFVPLQDAVRDKVASLVAPKECEAFQLLFGLKEPPACDAAACLQLLSSGPRLASPEHRTNLLRKLLDQPEGIDEAAHRRAVRYLLHASRDHINETAPLFARSSLSGGGTLSRVVRAALRELGAEWRVLPDSLCDELSEKSKQQIGVRTIDNDTLIELLSEIEGRNRSFDWLAELNLTVEEAESLLIATSPPEFVTTWRSLPLHRAYPSDGRPGDRRVSLEESHCYLAPADGRVELGTLQGYVTILHRPADGRLKDLYVNRGVCEWGPLPQLREALAQAMPVKHAVSVLQALASISAHQLALPEDSLRQLRERKWLESRGEAVCPEDIIDLPEIEDDLARLLSNPALRGTFTCLASVSPNLRHEHRSALGVMRQRYILPNRERSLELLGVSLGEVEAYRIGEIPALRESPVRLRDVVRALRGASGLPVVFELLEHLYAALPEHSDKIGLHIAPGIARQCPLATLRVCVEQLAAQSERTDCSSDADTRRVLAWYLGALASHPSFATDQLKGLRLPSRAGTWRTTDRLCFDAEGVDPDYLLDSELADVFPESVRKHAALTIPATPISSETRVAGGEFVTYFQPWQGSAPRALIGGFLALLGNDPAILEEAQASLHPRSVRTVREQINWKPIEGSVTVGADEDIHAMMAKQRFRILYGEEGQPVRVRNLLGGEFEARIGALGASLFVGSVFFERGEVRDGLRYKTVRLRRFDPSNIGSQQLSGLLLESARVLLRDVYCRTAPELDHLWSDLGEAHQLQLEIVQHWLLDNAWALLAQLGSGGKGELKTLIRQREELERRRAEIQAGFGNDADRTGLQTQFAALNEELRRLFVSDSAFQLAMLRAVRDKMEHHYQYSIDSLPFELYQNADDAAAELADMMGGADRLQGGDTFQLRVTDLSRDADTTCLYILHWGRAINEFHRGAFSAECGRERGYDTDLKKMLTLSASNKAEREQLVTGRFGLGFKTVFFVTDVPRVVSGDLAFEVLGGMFPSRLSDGTLQRLRAILADSPRPDGTVFELPLLESTVDAVHQAIKKFIAQCPLMLAFSRCIKRCEILIGDQLHTLGWCEQQLTQVPSVFVGQIAGCASHGPHRALVFRGDNNAALLIGLAADGAISLAKDTPTFWVTVPTRSGQATGFAVNASFRPDVGRTQLALSRDGTPVAENLAMVRQLGVSVGRQLVHCFDVTKEHWLEACSQLGLVQDTGPERFWRSIWDVLSCQESRDNPLLTELLWEAGRGLAELVTHRPALPTKLPGKHDVLTELSRVRGSVGGILDEDEATFELVADWPSIEQHYDVGTLVSHSRVTAQLSGEVKCQALRWPVVRLLDALKLETNEPGVSPQTAARLGLVLSRKTRQEWLSKYGHEYKDIAQYLSDLRFQTAAGGWSHARQLLVHSVDDSDANKVDADERMRAAFAPAERVLSSDYHGHGVEFFLLCRGELHAPAELLAEWTINASARDTRQAALRYLASGRLAREVLSELSSTSDGTWLGELTPALLAKYGLGEGECNQILAALTPNTSVLIERLGGSVAPAPTPLPSISEPGVVLHRIHEWWCQNRGNLLQEYDEQLYPDGRFPIAVTSGGPIDRTGWLSLFLLACAQTMGRSQDTQRRDFLRLCLGRGWIEDLAHIRERSRDWLRCWREYVAGQIDRIMYFHWMKQLLGLSVIAYWLDEYVEALLALRRATGPLALEDVMNPRSSPMFSGGGPDAPPLAPILGIGQCFILRELIRKGVLDNQFAHRWCYVPHSRVRRLIERLNGPIWNEGDGERWRFSVNIHEFLNEQLGSDHTFCCDFDIPLTIIAERRNLWQHFLSEEPPDELMREDA